MLVLCGFYASVFIEFIIKAETVIEYKYRHFISCQHDDITTYHVISGKLLCTPETMKLKTHK